MQRAMTATGIALVDMTDARYRAYIERAEAEYAREGARATGTVAEDAVVRARAQFVRLLPDGRVTAGQHFKTITGAAGEELGVLWCASRLDESPPALFLYDLVVHPDHRRQGIGAAAMRLLEDEARRVGARRTALHVFAHNTQAIRLYERLGYEVTSRGEGGMRMQKAV